ncbi:hypothetical protein [Methylocystis sp. S23]
MIAEAQRRPLRRKKFDRLQQLLACMRMVCDTPAILDPNCRISPKPELEKILADLLDEPDRKVTVFSEWERMLTMVRELAGEMGVEAKLEQRIARAWRKNQRRSVSVVNLVTEDSIEHSILHLIGQKQALADGVLDGAGDVSALKMPSGRGAFIERMQAMMGERPRGGPRMVSAQEAFVGDLVDRLGERALLVEERRGADGRPHLLIVVDADGDGLAAEPARAAAADAFTAEFVGVAAWRAMRRLAGAGLLQFSFEARELYRAPGLAADSPAAAGAAPREADAIAEADRALRMAKTLADGGFPEEAPALLAKSLRAMATALLAARAEAPVHGQGAADSDIRRLVDCGALPSEAMALLQKTQSPSSAAAIEGVAPALASTARILATILV